MFRLEGAKRLIIDLPRKKACGSIKRARYRSNKLASYKAGMHVLYWCTAYVLYFNIQTSITIIIDRPRPN